MAQTGFLSNYSVQMKKEADFFSECYQLFTYLIVIAQTLASFTIHFLHL